MPRHAETLRVFTHHAINHSKVGARRFPLNESESFEVSQRLKVHMKQSNGGISTENQMKDGIEPLLASGRVGEILGLHPRLVVRMAKRGD